MTDAIRTIKLLLIEDDEDDYFIFKMTVDEIEDIDFKVDWIESYDKALTQMALHSYDLYFFDYQLGANTGLELLETVLGNGDNTPVILLTGQNNKEIDQKAMVTGATDYLVKGTFDGVMLERTIRYALERRKVDDKVKYLAYHDELTDLPNRSLFEDRVKQAIIQSTRFKRKFAIIFLDLDNFKGINDNYGHNAGDILLRQVSERLKNCIRGTDSLTADNTSRENDTIARQGGDEFILLLNELNQSENAVKAADRIIKSMAEPVHAEGQVLYTSVSLGIAIFPDNGTSMEELMKNADSAMYEAKKAGKNTYRYFDETVNESASRKLNVEKAMQRALAENLFRIELQPRINLNFNSVCSFEALLRLNDSTLGVIEPSEFIPVAEEVGLIIPLGEWVIVNACQTAKKMYDANTDSPSISINVSIKQFKQKNFVTFIERTLQEYKLPAEKIALEFDEDLLNDTKDNFSRKIARLDKLGIKLSIDHFGSGSMALTSLIKTPINALIIDKQLTAQVSIDSNVKKVVNVVVEIAKYLDLDLVALGIETQEQLEFFKALGIHHVQGFYFSQSMKIEDALSYQPDVSGNKSY